MSPLDFRAIVTDDATDVTRLCLFNMLVRTQTEQNGTTPVKKTNSRRSALLKNVQRIGKRKRRSQTKKLNIQSLEARQLLAANVLDDALTLSADSSINVLTNDTSGSEVQTVSAFQADFDRVAYDPGVNATDWFIPDRPGQPGVPQRSLIAGAVFGGAGNRGDLDLYVDADDQANANDLDTRLDSSFGMALPMLRDNTAVDATGANLGVVQYASEGGGDSWIAMGAAPENNGEISVPVSNAYFPYDAGWVGGTYDSGGGLVAQPSATATAPTVVSVAGNGRFEATVPGVTDSYNEGFLFSVGADNEDNYTRTRPIDGGKWSIAHRDNAAEINGGEEDDINLLYIPRSAQGLIGGVVNGGFDGVSPMRQSFGDFSIQRETDGFWRVSVPGHDVTSGVIIAEAYDLTNEVPVNAYFSYDDAGDGSGDILIRQFAWNSNAETPLNTDFVFFFIPFENTLSPTNTLTVTSVGTDAGSLSNNLSSKGLPLAINADGTIDYQTGASIRALGAGQTDSDTFVYEATDGVDSALGTVTVNWVGVNDAPEVLATPADLVINEDAAATAVDLTALFADVDSGDTLTYSIDTGLSGLLSGQISGTDAMITPSANQFGYSVVTVTATDLAGESVSVSFGVSVVPQNDGVVAVDDTGAVTDKMTAVSIDVLGNDYHPDTTIYSVSAAAISGNVEATGDSNTVWGVAGTTASPNDLTIQSAANLGDVAIGRGGEDLFLSDGVLLGTVADNTTPYSTVETYAAFGSYGFATGVGIGGGERTTPVNAAFFPFAEGWTSGHIAADGSLIGGVGVSQDNIRLVQPGLFEVTIPEANSPYDGMLFAMGGSNDDNIVSVLPGFDNRWLVRQLDSDDDATGFKNAPISFVYIPAGTNGLIGGNAQFQEGSYFMTQSFGDVSVGTDLSGAPLVQVNGYTPEDGVLIAVSSATEYADINGGLTNVPSSQAVFATPSGNGFRVDLRQSGTYNLPGDAGDFQFIFLPYDSPLERFNGLDFAVTSYQTTSALGATISLDGGSFSYDPTNASAAITGLGNGESVEDTFTYTIEDGRGSTSVATVTITVQGENQTPTAYEDVINVNEQDIDGIRLSVLGNDVDPDVEALLGTPSGIPSANLAVDESGIWTVAQTGTGDNSIVIGDFGNSIVEVLHSNDASIDPTQGVVLATIRENFDSPNTSYRLVQAFANGFGGTSLALQQFGADGAANANVSVAYFSFADNWVGGHVDASGMLTSGNGVSSIDISKSDAGRYEVSIPGVTDAAMDGFLFVIGNENADNVASVQAIPGTSRYAIAVRDNTQDFGDGEDGGFSFVFVPRNAQNLVAGTIDPFVEGPNTVTRTVGEYTVERQDVDGGGFEWKLSIPGQTPETGMLVLTNQDDGEIEDNFLSYGDDGEGNFIIRSHDMPNLGRQNQPFSFAFIPFDGLQQPAARPVPGLLSVESVDATTALGSTVAINADGTITYTPSTAVAELYTGDTAVDTFSYTMTDGFGGSSTATVTINIAGYGEAPAVASSAGASYYGIGDLPVGIDGMLSVTPIGDLFADGAVATFELVAGQLPSDQLAIRNEGTDAGQVGVSGTDVTFGGTVVASFVAGSGSSALTITFNSDADEASVEAVLRAVTFEATEPGLTGGLRNVQISFVDGNGMASETQIKEVELGLVYRRSLQQSVDAGYGIYTGVSDAQIRENNPTLVSAPEGDMLVDFDSGGNAAQVLLQFADMFGDGPGQIPSDAIITSANLVVYTDNTGDGGQFFRLAFPFDAATATWDAFGGGIQTDSGEVVGAAQSQIGTSEGGGATGTGEHFVSVLPDVRAWAAGEANNGWVMDGWTNRTDGWAIRSSENGDPTTGPRLEIEWVPAGTQVATFRDGVNDYMGTSDTLISSVNPDQDYSQDGGLFIDYDGSQGRGLIRFDDIIGEAAGQIPAGAKVISARLRTASIANNSQGDGARFYPMLTGWQDTDTYNSLGNGVSIDGVEAADEYTAFAGNANRDPNAQAGFQDWDVTNDLQLWVSGQRDNNGWLFEPWENGTDGWGFETSESSEILYRPQLEVVYTVVESPQITVTGSNSEAIDDGEIFVSPLAGTDFGSVEVSGGTATKTFTVDNPGTVPLNITGASITGDEASAFGFGVTPVFTIIPGGSVSFDVTFDATKQGIHDATIELSTDGVIDGVFTFAIRGNGTGFQALSATPNGATSFAPVGGIDSGLSGAEISAFDPASQRLFVTSGSGLQIVDLSNPASPVLLSTLAPTADGASDDAITSVAVSVAGIVAAAVPGADEQADGHVFFYSAVDGLFLGSVQVGALPDMVTFTPDGMTLLVANEGEPGGDPIVDPAGSVSIVDLSTGVATATVQTADFTSFDGSEDALRAAGVKLTSGNTVSQDVEPEYITVVPDGSVAVVTLQENNAVAIIDLSTATVTDILPLGYKDHAAINAQIDPTNNSPDALTLGSFPVRGLFQPDAIANYIAGGSVYFVTANEGDARDAEETDIQSVTLDPTMFPAAAALQDANSAGELEITNLFGDADGDGDFDVLYSYGARSFSIWNETGDLVFDSGDLLARATDALGLYDDGRSDNKGTEPEGVTIGQIDESTYAFIGMERANATAVFDITDPSNVVLTQILHDTNDVSPEGLTFISAADSPNGSPMLVVSNEVSNSLRVYSIGASVIPEVEGIVINDGGASRSQITSVTVTFNTEVDLAAVENAFTLTNVDSTQEVSGLIVDATHSGGKTIVVLTFDSADALVVNRVGTGVLGNSLIDGNYQLDIAAANVVSGGSAMATDYLFGGQTAADSINDDFFRLYGDASGDGVVDFSDLDNHFAPSFFATEGSPSFDASLDSEGNGVIDFDDLDNGFAPNFFKSRS
ncbi:choice-of-anchor I family protein [Stieleria sp. JC731]|uniref:choice-of-anchor I family protein n=1 Tax=Stieleria sp. JC731 TaxID=2894195 RepID=UPI001E641086|nr:choice-of-anchor I family protein [Stieleria sp. JC731]MCC9599428.1 choice-of-anchor I family protein [Stieleria sp. JC731]